MSKKYRKKPVVIDAEQLTPEIALDCLINDTAGPMGVPVFGNFHRGNRTLHMAYAIIETREGRMRADLNDWIIRGVKGELYPCKPDVFEATYEPA